MQMVARPRSAANCREDAEAGGAPRSGSGRWPRCSAQRAGRRCRRAHPGCPEAMWKASLAGNIPRYVTLPGAASAAATFPRGWRVSQKNDAVDLDPNRSFNEYDSFRFRWPVLDWSSTWQKVTRENQRARRSWPRPPPVLWRAVVGKFAHPQRAICGCQACAARARQNGLSGPSGTFLAVSRCSSLGRFAARVGFWPPGRVGFLPLPVGGDCCRGGGCVRGRRAARTWLLLLVPFFG